VIGVARADASPGLASSGCCSACPGEALVRFEYGGDNMTQVGRFCTDCAIKFVNALAFMLASASDGEVKLTVARKQKPRRKATRP
jgi:hypothetical protein